MNRFVRTCSGCRFTGLLLLWLALTSCAATQAHYTRLQDQAYGRDPRQVMDVYIPENASDATVILMVHGGGWRRGDKANGNAVDNKIARWVNQGFVFVSINYRMRPDADPLTQADDVARALAYVQRNAGQWRANPRHVILMGHSAGAHLISLLNSDADLAKAQGASPWLGAVAIDSGGFDIDAIMRRDRVLRLYKQAFGDDPGYWKKASPLHRLQQKQAPLLAICSTERKDQPCREARRYQDKAHSLKMRVEVLPMPLSHRQINKQLGEDSDYTRAVEAFMASLHPAVKQQLGR